MSIKTSGRQRNAPLLFAIAAVDNTGAIGKTGQIPWHIPEDLRRFKRITTNSCVIVGRKTHESIVAGLGEPLPKRHTIVLSRSKRPSHKRLNNTTAVQYVQSIKRAIDVVDTKRAYVAGGASVYRKLLPYCIAAHITRVDQDTQNADTFFPMDILQKQFILEDKVRNTGYSFCFYENQNPKPLTQT